jgi:peptidoglycan/xylan/chitin deacetylase (PgdA/CDA1 family)
MHAAEKYKTMSRMSIKGIGFRIAYYFGLINLLFFLNSKKITILAYHGVSTRDRTNGIRNQGGNHLAIAKFSKQIEYLAKHRKVVPLTDVIELLSQGQQIPPGVAAITFDDGYRSIRTLAWPVLKSWGIPATVFIATRWINSQEMLWFDKIEYAIEHIDDRGSINIQIDGHSLRYPISSRRERIRTCYKIKELCKSVDNDVRQIIVEELSKLCGNNFNISPDDDYAPLSWNEIIELNAHRSISFGSHSDGHGILSKLSSEQAKQDILVSKSEIESHLGEPARFFAYPNGLPGDFNEGTKRILREAGFSCGLSTISGMNDCDTDKFELRRVCVSNNDDLFGFLAKLSGLTAFFSRLKNRLTRASRRQSPHYRVARIAVSD